MNQHVEDQVRQIFAEDAEQAPTSTSLAIDVRRKVRRRQALRVTLAAGSLAAASVAVAVLVNGEQPGPADQRDKIADARDTIASASALQGRGPLPDSGAERCIENYSVAEAIGRRAFAFDGTISRIDVAEAASGPLAFASVTFEVNEWFSGGSDATVTVQMVPPTTQDLPRTNSEDSPPLYGVGTRLLVSGEPRWGGAPLEDAIAWTCGFTRYYDASTAEQWRASAS